MRGASLHRQNRHGRTIWKTVVWPHRFPVETTKEFFLGCIGRTDVYGVSMRP